MRLWLASVRQIAVGCSHLTAQDLSGSRLALSPALLLALQNKKGVSMRYWAARGRSERLLECFVLKFEASKPKTHQAYNSHN